MTKVLVIEDEDAIRRNTALLLELEGYEVVTAENGVIGLALAREHLPELVISDVMMPGWNGLELLAYLRADALVSHIPVILLTARTNHEDIREGMACGADDYLPKPFQRQELLVAVRSQLEKAQQRQGAAARLAAQAQRLLHQDALTGLPNRNLLSERLQSSLSAISMDWERLAVILVGLDGFSHINDSLGRSVGDQLLQVVASRMNDEVGRGLVGPHDGVGRLEGDVFVLVLGGFPDQDYITSRVQSLLLKLKTPYPTASGDQFLGASIGVALFPEDGRDGETLLGAAETALRVAKASGGDVCHFYAADMNAVAAERLALHNDLFRALERGQIELYYQPQVAIASGKVVGFEALMRWHHPERGMVSPVRFIPLAESNGQILPLGAWALDEACRQVAEWRSQGLPPVRMAVNLAARQFVEPGLVELVRDCLTRHQLPPECLELEITEGTAMESGERTVTTLHQLKQLGVKLALDDFGTGYSSLAYLKRFPLDVLKVDQLFVRNLIADPGDAAIVRAVVALAHSFGMSVIAEGVETAEHLAYLTTLDCAEYQGYYFGKPVPAREAVRFLQGASDAGQ